MSHGAERLEAVDADDDGSPPAVFGGDEWVVLTSDLVHDFGQAVSAIA